MTAPASMIDRGAVALLAPSLAAPVVAFALAGWGTQHADDGYVITHVGVGLYYFAAMITLSATFFSMTINAVLLVQRHLRPSTLTVPWARTVPHYLTTVVVVVWAIYFSVVRMQLEGVWFGIALVALSVWSFARVTAGDRAPRQKFTQLRLRALHHGALRSHPIAVVICIIAAVLTIRADNHASLIALAALGLLGLPLSGGFSLFWLPIFVLVVYFDGSAVWWVFLVVAGLPAIISSVAAVALDRSESTRVRFVNAALQLR